MAGPLNPDAGRSIYPNPDDIVSASDPISSADMGDIIDHYEGRITHLESEAEQTLQVELGSQYHPDPFMIPINKLPSDIKRDFVNRIDELTGMKDIIAQGMGPTMFKDYDERSPAGRFVFDPAEMSQEEIDPRILRMTQQTVRYDHARSIDTTERYYSAGTHLRQRVLNNIQRQLDTKLSTDVVEDGKKRRAGKTLVFDVETPGLKPEEGIWQISARMMNPNGTYEDLTRSFNNPRMQWGGEVGQSRQTLQDFLNPQGTVGFEEGMRDFLRMADEADFVAGHNVLFDYRAISHGLTNTPAYINDEEFRGLADRFMRKFYNPDTGKMGNVIDTNQLSRVLLHNMPLAQELEGGQSPYQFSMQNILLQTNLLARVKGEIGDEAVGEMLQRGTHFADVDVPFESYLLKYLQEGAQGGEGLAQFPSGEYGGMTEAERARIVGSQAFTPNLPLTTTDYLHPIVAEKARAAGILEEGNTHITPLENMVIASRDLTMESRSPHGRILTAGQKLLSKFQISDTMEGDLLDTANSAGIWRRMFGQNVTKGGTIRRNAIMPTPEEWEATQKALQQAHIPLPGLSWMERHLTATLGTAGGGFGEEERHVRSVFGADVAPMGRFYGSEKVDVVGKSQITKVPMQLLEEWEQTRIDAGEDVRTSFTRAGETPQMLQGSFFNIGDHSEMSLVAQIDEDEKQNLLDFLKQHDSVLKSDNPDRLIANLESSFAENTGTYGVQVGTLTDLKGGMGVEEVRRTFEQVMGIGADQSDQTPIINFPYVGRNLLEDKSGENSLYTMGALINTDTINADEGAALARSTAEGAERYRQLFHARKSPMMTLLEDQAKTVEGLSDLGPARSVVRAYSGLRRNAPIIGAAAALGGLSYYKYRKKKEDQKLSEVMAFQPTSPNPPKNYGLVQQLDNNKIGHTQMGASKYSYLFGTGYQ